MNVGLKFRRDRLANPTSRMASVQRCHERGYLMIETLIYIAVWFVVVGLTLASFFRCLSSSRDLNRNADDIARVLRAGEQWRDDVREASSPPRLVIDEEATALEIPKPSGLTVYVFEKNVVWRKADLAAPWHKLLAGVKSSRMERAARQQVSAWSWEVELHTKKKLVRVTPLFSFLAVAPADQKP